MLELHFLDMQDMEFTVQEGKLYILQTRNGKRSPPVGDTNRCRYVEGRGYYPTCGFVSGGKELNATPSESSGCRPGTIQSGRESPHRAVLQTGSVALTPERAVTDASCEDL